ncbi:hypothetical protein [Bacteroides pyogenes]|nr:hypothetical protein [Bacteroides pyogenes]
MANLGNLFYSVYLKDMTDADKEKIRKKVESMTAKLDVTVSSSTIQKAVKAALSGHTFKADITPNIKKSGLGKVDIAANSTNIRKSINDALKGQTFKAHVNMVVDKAKVDDAIKKAFARAGMRYDTTASDLRAAKIAAIQTKAEAAAASSRELTRQRAARAAKAELDLANARDRSSSAARRHVSATLSMNGAMSSQLSIAGQLRNEFLSLYSIYAVQNFLRAVVDIGGELENQRIAMSSILQDAGKATTIFNQIKSLAVASPFGVMDLNQYSKQLSAYSVPYNELYDTMKRLADISAGVGVDMGRIILAYGQIKAAKFLKGTELRQLTEANIPMVDKLSERFSKLEGRIVSAGEVLEMISKKKVTFEDVKDVLWELTDEGGMFNNMQEALSQSVKSKWKNLADAIDIMLGDIAESMGSTLKWTAESLTALAQNWKELVPVIQAAVGAFGAYKAATFMSSRLFGSEYKSITQSILANKRLTAEKLRVEAAYRRLTVAEQQLIATSNKLTYADYEQMAVSGQLTKNKLMLLVAMKKLTAVQAESIALQAKMGRLNVSNSSYIGMMNVGVKALWGSLKNLGAAMVGLINPFTITFAGLELIFTLLHKSGQKADEMNERISELTTKAQEGFKSLTKEAQKFADVDPFNANDASLISSIEKIKTALKDYSPVWAETFNEAFKTDDEGKAVKSLAEQYILLRDALNDTRDAYKLLNDIKGTAEHANETTDGYFDESFSENIKDYIKAEKRVEKVIGRMTGSYIEYSTAMQKVIDKHKDFANAALGKPLKEQLHIIKEYPKALSSLNNELPLMYRDDVFQLRKAWGISKRVLDEDVLPDMEKFMSEYRSRLRAAGWDLDNLNQAQKIAIGLDIRAFLDQFEKMKAHTREFFNERLLEKGFNIKVNVEYTETVQAISDLQKKFNEATDGKFEAQIKVSTDSEKIIEGIQKAYKEAKETTNQLKPILIKAGIDFSGIDAIDLSKLPEWQKQIVSDYRKALGIVRAGDEGSKELGFSLTDTSKDKKDAFAEKMKERVNLLKDAYSEYKKWSGLIGKEEAAKKIKESGIFDSLFKGKEPVNIDNYRDELNKIFNQLDDKTKERRELKVSIQKVLFDIDADAMKEASDKALKEVEEYIAEITKRWDFYKQLYGTTGDKNWAMNIAFSNPTYFDEAATQMVDSLNGRIKAKGLSIDIPFSETKENAKKLFGENNEDLFNLWKAIKERIENGGIDVWKSEAKAMQDYLNEYGTFQQKKLAIEKEYAAKIAEARSKGNVNELRLLENQRDSSLHQVEVNAIKQSVDWGSVFGEFGTMFREQLQPTIDKLRAISLSDEFKSAKLEEQKVLHELIKKLEQSNAVWDGDIFKKVSDDLIAYQSAMRDYIDAQERERQATEALTQAKRALEKAEKSGDSVGARNAQTEIVKTQSALNSASDDVKRFGMQVQETTSDLQSSSSKAVSMFQDLESGLKGLASGNLQGIGEGLMKLDKIFNNGELTKTVGNSIAKGIQSLLGKNSKASKAISEALGNSGFIGAIISAILSILDVLKDGIGALVSSLIDTVLNAANGILKNLLNFNTSVQIFDSIKKGIGGLLDAITWGGFSSWIDTSNAKEVAKTTERLTNSNERLKSAVDNLKDEMSKSGGWKAIDATKQAREDQKKINDQTMQILQTQMGYHGAHHSNEYYWRLGREDYASLNKSLADYKRKNPLAETNANSVYSLADVYKLTPEQMNYIRTYNIEMWEKMLGQGKYNKREFWDNYADLAGKLEEITEALKETLTQTSFDALRNSFVDALLDMDAKAEDFANDFSEYMMKSILNAKISDLLDDELREFYNKWAEYAKSDNEITDAEQKALNNMWNALVQKGIDIRDQVSAITGYAGKDGKQSSGLSKGIQSITEDTAHLLASYINSMRSDLSFVRSIIEQKYGEVGSDYSAYMSNIVGILSSHSSLFETNNAIALAQLQQLSMIVSNTGRSADSNDEILEVVSELRDDVHGAKVDKNRGWHIQ